MANIFRPSTWLRSKAETPITREQALTRSHTGGTQETATELDEPETSELESRGAPAEVEITEPSMRERIEQRAYFLWCEAGCPNGDDVNYWLAAEKELLEESQRD